jgi:hypothetical protein
MQAAGNDPSKLLKLLQAAKNGLMVLVKLRKSCELAMCQKNDLSAKNDGFSHKMHVGKKQKKHDPKNVVLGKCAFFFEQMHIGEKMQIGLGKPQKCTFGPKNAHRDQKMHIGPKTGTSG